MAQTRTLWITLRAVALPATAVIVVAFFGGYALFGSNGVLAWGDYSRRLEVRRAELARIENDKARLANRVALLDPKHADVDMVDELVRRDLGVANPHEVIIRLR